MCAHVAFAYCDMLWCVKYRLCSALPSVAFLLAIPYLLGIIIVFAAAYILGAIGKRTLHNQL